MRTAYLIGTRFTGRIISWHYIGSRLFNIIRSSRFPTPTATVDALGSRQWTWYQTSHGLPVQKAIFPELARDQKGHVSHPCLIFE